MKHFLFVVALLASLNPAYAVSPIKSINQMTTDELIVAASTQFNQDPHLVSKIAFCESGLQILPHDGGRGINMTGIHDTTFLYWLPMYEKETGETLDIKSTYDQFKMMSWAFSRGYANQWTTYVAYKNGGTYTFRDVFTGKMTTVHCS